MTNSIPFGARSTADNVLAGVALYGKHFLVTGCSSGIGRETLQALAANGAHVIGLARSLAAAESACREAGPSSTPLACDLSDFSSVAEAGAAIRSLNVPLDAVVANAGIAHLPSLRTRYGVEMQFLVNHLGHFALLNEIAAAIRDATGRIVIVSSSASIKHAPPEGIMFDNLDGRRFYKPSLFYGQSKLANALFAKELSRRMAGRGIAVNSAHPGAARGTGLHQAAHWTLRAAATAARWFMKTAARAAATPALLAASPRVAGISGEYWADCQVAEGNPLLNDTTLARRLWDVSSDIVARHSPARTRSSAQLPSSAQPGVAPAPVVLDASELLEVRAAIAPRTNLEAA
jgi:WW domain-containing oxidoreductase